jgi:uncharacterized membrane protein
MERSFAIASFYSCGWINFANVSRVASLTYSPSCIWDSGAIGFLILTWTVMLSVTPDMMSRRAKLDDDEGRFAILSLMKAASCTSLFAIGFILHDKKGLSTGPFFYTLPWQ